MFGNKKVLGIEIGRDDLHAVELNLIGKNRFYISRYYTAELDRSVLNEGVVVDEDAFEDAFVNMYNDAGFTARKAVFGLDNQTTILRFASFPKVDEGKQRGLVLLNAQEHIPVPVSELELDYVTVGESEDEDGSRVNVLLCAVNKKSIQRILDVTKASSLSVNAIMPSQVAYANAVLSRIDRPDFMAVRIGKKSVYHIVFENRSIAFLRYLNLNSEVISLLKAATGRETLFLSNIEAMRNDIIRNINATINYYRVQNRREVNYIYITGGSALHRYLSSDIDSELHSSVEFLRLFEPDARRGSSPPEEFDSCISLALNNN